MIIGEATISKSSILVKLNQKYAQLNAIDQKEIKDNFIFKTDYIELNGNNYDKNDYERVLDKFKNLDAHIRSHEQSHASSINTTTPISYNYQMGPDGKMYATGGYVRLDTSIPTDPKAAITKLDKIQHASNNSDMSGADSSISRAANIMKMKLQLENKNGNI